MARTRGVWVLSANKRVCESMARVLSEVDVLKRAEETDVSLRRRVQSSSKRSLEMMKSRTEARDCGSRPSFSREGENVSDSMCCIEAMVSISLTSDVSLMSSESSTNEWSYPILCRQK